MEWNLITRTQAEELAFLHIKTVEQLASVKDSNIQNFMGGYTLRDKAKKWLETDNTDRIDAEKEEMREDIKMLKARIAELSEPVIPTDKTGTEPEIEGAAVPVPAAPAARKARPRRK
jgi:hypothetical protein